MASFSTLPLDLTKEILYRTPAESLVRAKATCKQWNDLIKDKRFIYEHWRRSPERFLRADQTVQILDLVTRTRLDSPIPDELQLSISNAMAMVHCDGLMLCVWSDKEYFMFHNIALWNPLTRNFNVVEHRLARESHRFLKGDNFGIGYDVNKPRGNYKILMFSANHYCEAVVEIYECMSKSWRTIVDSKVDWEAYPWDHGVSVVGCFDGDKLSLLHQNQNYPSPIEVWVSSNLAVGNVTFAKYFSVSSSDFPEFRYLTFWAHPVYCIAKHERIIAWYTVFSTCLIVCEIDEGGVSNRCLTSKHYWDDCIGTFNCGYIYKPSLVPLP
ncbi:putative F-box only protein 15 [Raphanus sativus]|nr:putative F-box only protein 15 [Raphanus sativus]